MSRSPGAGWAIEVEDLRVVRGGKEVLRGVSLGSGRAR